MRVAGATDSPTNTTRVVRRDESTTVLLIRHARTGAIARHRPCGRLPGIPRSASGVSEAEELGRTLAASCRLAAIYSSPVEHAYHTATSIARHQEACVELCEALLDPGGEELMAVQRRIVRTIERLATKHPGATIALVAHAEIVRVALLHYGSATLDRNHELEIAPASVSAVNVSPGGVYVQFVNRRAAALRS